MPVKRRRRRTVKKEPRLSSNEALMAKMKASGAKPVKSWYDQREELNDKIAEERQKSA